MRRDLLVRVRLGFDPSRLSTWCRSPHSPAELRRSAAILSSHLIQFGDINGENHKALLSKFELIAGSGLGAEVWSGLSAFAACERLQSERHQQGGEQASQEHRLRDDKLLRSDGLRRLITSVAKFRATLKFRVDVIYILSVVQG